MRMQEQHLLSNLPFHHIPKDWVSEQWTQETAGCLDYVYSSRCTELLPCANSWKGVPNEVDGEYT